MICSRSLIERNTNPINLANQMKNIIVTGATGCVGSAIVRRALDQGIDVTCIVHQSSKRLSNLPVGSRVKVVECNLSDYSSLDLEGKYDAFIHLSWENTFGASRDDAEVQTRNIQYTLDAVHLAHRCGCKVFVGAGSQAEYGVQTVVLTPDMPVKPESGYGIAKYAAGKLSAILCKSLGMRQNWVRILSVFGPNDGENTLISYVIRELKAGRSPKLTKCEQKWDYLYADDAGDAILAIVERGIDGRVYPLGFGKGRRLHEYIEDVHQIVNPSVEIKYGARDYYPHQPMCLVADVRNLIKDTGWDAKVSFTEGIKKII